MQKSFDLEEHFKNNIDNLDEKDEKLHQFLAEPSNPNQKKLSHLDVKRYQENQMQLEKEKENSNVIPDLISNFTDNNKEFFSEDSRVQNSIAESIDYKYFDHLNDESNKDNITKLNKEREFPVNNSTVNEEKGRRGKVNGEANENIRDNNNDGYRRNYSKVNYDNYNENNDDNNNINDHGYYKERNLENYDSNNNEKNQKRINDDKNDYRNQQQNHHRNDYNAQDEDLDFDEYEEEEEYEEENENENENEEDYESKHNQNNRVKIGPDGIINNNNNNNSGNANKQSSAAEQNKPRK